MDEYFNVMEGEIIPGRKHIFPKKPKVEVKIDEATTTDEATEDTSAAEDTPVGLLSEELKQAEES